METILKFSDLWHQVGSQLRDEMYKPGYDLINNLTMIDLSIIQMIEEYDDIIFKELSNTLNIPKSTLTSAIQRLEKQGYVTRRKSEIDGRQFHLSLTDKGSKAQEQHLETEAAIFGSLLSGLTPEDRELFVNLFAKAIEKEDLI